MTQDNQVTEITEYLLHAMGLWLTEHPNTKHVDLMMGFHSAHKTVVHNIAKQWEKELNMPYQQTIRVADLSWRRAMKELWRSVPNNSNNKNDDDNNNQQSQDTHLSSLPEPV